MNSAWVWLRAIVAAGALAVAALPSPAPAQTLPKPPCYPASPGPALARPILAFGDSITMGSGATANCGWPNPAGRPASRRDRTYEGDLSRLLGVPVLNDGLPGEEAVDGQSRLAAALQRFHPGTVLLMEGTNDISRGRTAEETARVIALDLDAINRAGAVPVLLTPPPIGLANAPIHQLSIEYAGLLVALGARRHIDVVDVESAFAARPILPLMTQYKGFVDYTHPGDAGYMLIATLVDQVLDPPPAHPAIAY